LVAAAAAAPPGGPEQQQLFALFVSKLKVLMYNPASKKASLIAMHPMEQVGVIVVRCSWWCLVWCLRVKQSLQLG
jgi:hypothetical protein